MTDKKTITRRAFLKVNGLAAVALPAFKTIANIDLVIRRESIKIAGQNQANAAAAGAERGPGLNAAPEFAVALVGVERDAAEQVQLSAVKDAAQTATDFAWLSQGAAVLIKVALNSGNPFPATTSPMGIRAMVELLLEKGAGRVIVSDMSGIEHVKLTPDGLHGSSRELMHASGIAQAALTAGAELHFPEEAGWDAFFEDHPVDTTHWNTGIMMPDIIRDVDHIVLMPRCSRHLLLGSSLGLKCAVGYWRTDSRLEYHKHASTIQEKTADANTVSCLLDKQRLVITDATKILTTLGPDDGFVAQPDTGLVIASESVVAHDMLALAWLLQSRLAMDEEEIARSRDPYQRQFVVNNLNRFVVMRLGNLGEAFQAERLIRNDILSIWDDRVLNRAYQVFGGIPEISMITVKNTVPQAVIDSLAEMVSR
ncbi:MAG: DUF362 domain-containing protein [Anaerolineales bacterium]|nr:DUF362 domain-containing protein [Anaerolineales bacterium]